MRQSYSESEIQRWALVDLNPWHESLLRQQLLYWSSIQSVKSEDGSPKTAALPLESIVSSFQWTPNQKLHPSRIHLNSTEQHPGASDPERLGQFHVLIVDANSNYLAQQQVQSAGVIRLVWDWGPSKRLAHQVAELIHFDGVIRDFGGLRSWIRICRDKGLRSIVESHPILSKIPIPSLTTPAPIAGKVTHQLQADRKSK